MRRILAACAILLLAGCETVPAPMDIQVMCPAVKVWSPDQQTKLLAEVHALPSDSILLTAVLDYEQMRDEARACQKSNQRRSP